MSSSDVLKSLRENLKEKKDFWETSNALGMTKMLDPNLQAYLAGYEEATITAQALIIKDEEERYQQIKLKVMECGFFEDPGALFEIKD